MFLGASRCFDPSSRGLILIPCSSSHGSSRYGQYYSPEELADIFAPLKTAVDTIRSWLESNGIPSDSISQSTNKQWIQFDAETEVVEHLFRTEYYVYEHITSGRTTIACEELVFAPPDMIIC